MFVLSVGKATISNDGATIMKLLDIVHPAAKTLTDIAKSQDAEVRLATTEGWFTCNEIQPDIITLKIGTLSFSTISTNNWQNEL